MNITILCVGKLKEKYWRDAEAEYSKRLKRFVNLQITELKESLLPANASPADEAAVREAEGEAILAKIKSSDHVISLEIDGKGLSSTQLSAKIEELGLQGKSSIVFVIGGSLGLSPAVSRRADFKLSFSAMTFPHQMMRIILLEQVRTLDKKRLRERMGHVEEQVMEKVDTAIAVSFGLPHDQFV